MSSKECEIISAKSSEMNVTYKKENEEEMEKETPIPEQFVTKWNAQKKAFETKVYESIWFNNLFSYFIYKHLVLNIWMQD